MESINLSQFRESATEHNVCSEYSKLWDDAISKADLFDVALSSEGCMFLCQSKAEGWGISTQYLLNNFGRLINHQYIRNAKGYTSAMYVNYTGIVAMDTTLLCIIDSDITVVVPDNYICKIYACGNTNITLEGNGRAIVVKYGSGVNVDLGENESSKVMEGEYEL